MPDNTILRLAGVGVTPYSARGLSEALEPIQQSIQLRRTINGVLTDQADALFQKYAVTISGEDQDPPALGNRWPGLQVVVDCITELSVQGSYEESTEGDTEGSLLGRTPVPGSMRTADGFTFYRPRLTMRVTGFNIERDEWGAVIRWSLALEES